MNKQANPHLQLTSTLVKGLAPNGPTDPIAYYKRPLVGLLFRKRINLGLEMLDGQRYAKALEVGYGSGAVLLALAPHVDELHGIDLDADPAPVDAHLRAQGRAAKLIQGNVYQLPYADAEFDLVVCFSVFEHLHEYPKGLDEVARVLKPGGRLLLGMPAVNRAMEVGFRAIGFRNIDHHHVTTPHAVAREFDRAGLRVVRERRLQLIPGAPMYFDWLLEKDCQGLVEPDSRNAAADVPRQPQHDAALRYRQQRLQYWNGYVGRRASAYYHRRLTEVYRFLVRPHSRVLELGCGSGDLLAALEPAEGVGLDFSPHLLEQAKSCHPQLRFVESDAHELNLTESFDYVILSDLVNELWDVQTVTERLASVCTPSTRVIINTYSRLWELPLAIARRLGMANPVLGQNWLTREDLTNMLALSGFEVIRQWREFLCPVDIPLLAPLCNRYLVKLWPLNHLALANFIVARPAPVPQVPAPASEPLVSVIVPARNEAGNIEHVVRRAPEMGAGTEIIFVEGHSRDDTWSEIGNVIERHPERRIKRLRQSGSGKGDAVRAGFAEAQGQVLMILDADLTVAPEDLPRFYYALRSGRGEFINGVRFVYPMEKQAMRPLNFLGNKFFSLAFSWLLGQPVKDTLCGTKVLNRADYDAIADNRSYFGDFDPFGDFDLLFGAARLDLKIADMPVRYHERTYGQTNIQRWKHGLLLLRMAAFALRRLKFI